MKKLQESAERSRKAAKAFQEKEQQQQEQDINNNKSSWWSWLGLRKKNAD